MFSCLSCITLHVYLRYLWWPLFLFLFLFLFQREPELLLGNDVLWTFVNFAGEDHTNFQTLVAFLNMLSTLVGSFFSVWILISEAFEAFSWTIYHFMGVLFRLLVKKVPQRFMSYSRVKLSALLGGALCLIACQFMMTSLNSLSKLLEPCYQSSQRGMQKH